MKKVIFFLLYLTADFGCTPGLLCNIFDFGARSNDRTSNAVHIQKAFSDGGSFAVYCNDVWASAIIPKPTVEFRTESEFRLIATTDLSMCSGNNSESLKILFTKNISNYGVNSITPNFGAVNLGNPIYIEDWCGDIYYHINIIESINDNNSNLNQMIESANIPSVRVLPLRDYEVITDNTTKLYII